MLAIDASTLLQHEDYSNANQLPNAGIEHMASGARGVAALPATSTILPMTYVLSARRLSILGVDLMRGVYLTSFPPRTVLSRFRLPTRNS